MNPSDAEIKERDGNRCARDGNVLYLHIHHRMLRSAGTDERACNRITLCAYCHKWVHAHPELALEQGWLTGRYQDPALIPVNHILWPAGPVLLTEERTGVKIWQDEEDHD